MLPHRLLIMALVGFGHTYPAIEIINDCVDFLASVNKYAEDKLLSPKFNDAHEESTVNPNPPTSSATSETSASVHLKSESTATLKPRTLPSSDIEQSSSGTTSVAPSTTRTTTGAAHEPPLSSSEVEIIEKTTVVNHSSSTSPLQQHSTTSSEPLALPTSIVPTTQNSDATIGGATDTTDTSTEIGATSTTSDQSPSPTAEALARTTSSSTSETPSKTEEHQEKQTIESKSNEAPSSSTDRTDSIKEEINPKSLAAFLKGRRSRYQQRKISTVQKIKNAWEKNWKSRTTRRPETTTLAPPTTTAPPPLEEWDEERQSFVEKREDAENWCITWTYDEGLSICNDFWRDLANFSAIAIITVVTAYFMN